MHHSAGRGHRRAAGLYRHPLQAVRQAADQHHDRAFHAFAALHRRLFVDHAAGPQRHHHAAAGVHRHRVWLHLRLWRHTAGLYAQTVPHGVPVRIRRAQHHRLLFGGSQRKPGRGGLQPHPQGDHARDHAHHPLKRLDGVHDRAGRLRHAAPHRRGLHHFAGRHLQGVHERGRLQHQLRRGAERHHHHRLAGGAVHPEARGGPQELQHERPAPAQGHHPQAGEAGGAVAAGVRGGAVRHRPAAYGVHPVLPRHQRPGVHRRLEPGEL